MHQSLVLRPLHRIATAVLLALLTIPSAHALSVVPRSFDELVTLADLVIVGTVSAQQSRCDTPEQAHISTYVTLSDLQVVKGALDDPQYTLRIAGGVVGDRAEEYPGLPQLVTGQSYVLFVRGNQRDFFPVVGIHQGVYHIVKDAAGREVVLPLQGDAQEAATSETLDAFLKRVRARLAETPRGNVCCAFASPVPRPFRGSRAPTPTPRRTAMAAPISKIKPWGCPSSGSRIRRPSNPASPRMASTITAAWTLP